MKITLYSTHCPKCTVLEKKLVAKGLEFDIVDNVDEVVKFGQDNNCNSAPILHIINDDKSEVLKFEDAVKMLNSLK